MNSRWDPVNNGVELRLGKPTMIVTVGWIRFSGAHTAGERPAG